MSGWNNPLNMDFKISNDLLFCSQLGTPANAQMIIAKTTIAISHLLMNFVCVLLCEHYILLFPVSCEMCPHFRTDVINDDDDN